MVGAMLWLVSPPRWSEDLRGLAHHLNDRQRLRALPAVAPLTVRGGAAQTMWVYAPGADDLTFAWDGPGGEAKVAPWGAGLFRIDAVAPRFEVTGAVSVRLTADGVAAERSLWGARALPQPRRPVVGPFGWVLAVSEETGEVIGFDAHGSWRVKSIGGGPTSVAWWDSNRWVVTLRQRKAVEVWGDTDETPCWILPVDGEPTRVATGEGGRAVVAVGDRLLELRRGPQGEPVLVQEIAGGLGVVDEVVFGRGDHEVVVADRQRASLLRFAHGHGTWAATGELRLGRPVAAVARSPEGSHLWVAVTAYHPQAGPQPGNHFVQDQILRVDLERWRVVEQRITARRAHAEARGDHTLSYQRGASPLGLAVDGQNRLWASFAGTDEVWRWEPEQPTPRMLLFGEEGVTTPQGLVVWGERWAVLSPSLGTVSVFHEEAMVAHHEMRPTGDELVASDPESWERRRGERAFYEATRSGRSCQSCHLHADSDLSAHDIGESGRMPHTLSVRGVAGTSPYLRGGTYAQLRDLHGVSEEVFGGYMREMDDRPEALEAFMRGLPLPPAPAATKEAVRGWDVFRRAQCDQCHVPPLFSDLGLHPESRLFPWTGSDAWWDTPSLLRVGQRAPYFFDGRAATLEEVLELSTQAGAGHGEVRALSPQERAALVAFLEQL